MIKKASMKRILALLLALVMAIPLFASPAMAFEPTGDYLLEGDNPENIAAVDWGRLSSQSHDLYTNPHEAFVFPDGVEAVHSLTDNDSTILSASQATQRPGRAEEIFLRRQGNNFEELDAIIQTLGEPIGMAGFEGEYSLGADQEIVEIAVQFSTPPTVALEILADARHPFVRGMDTTFESHALSAHERFQEQLFGLQRSSRSLGNMVIFEEFHSLFNGVFMSVPAGMVEHIAALPGVFAVTPNITHYAIGLLNNMEQNDDNDDEVVEDDTDLEEDEINDPKLTDEDKDEDGESILTDEDEESDASFTDEDENNDFTLTLADLASVIALAQEILGLVEISTDGLDVEEGVLWTTEEGFKALYQAVENAIMAYIVLHDAEELIEELLFNAISDLQNTLDEFLTLVETGEAVTLETGINTENSEDDFDPMDLFMREALIALDIENVRDSFGVTGRQVRVAVLDTGIDYNHPVFEPYRYYRNGVRSFRGWDAVDNDDDPMETTPWDRDPRSTSHGTHVAGTIAAIAPDIEMSHYRVLGPGGSSPTHIILLGIERAHKDEVDVMNLSLGANINLPFFPTAYALNLASLDGIVVVVAAGNSGPDAFTLGTPGVASLAITVGMAQMGGFGHFAMPPVLVDDNALSMRLRGWPFDFDTHNSGMTGELPYYSFGRIENVPEITDEDFEAFVANIRETHFEGGDLTGTIAVIFRGGTTFTSMRTLVQALNASALIVVDSQPFNPALGTALDGHSGANRIPIFWVDREEPTVDIFPRFRPAGNFGTINFGEEESISYEPLSDIMNPGSSRGPVLYTNHIKPDIVAPGTRIMSAVPSFTATPGIAQDGWYNAENYRYAFALYSGTSMASPAIAGIAALLVEEFPDAGPDEIRARIMNTARPLVDGEYGVYDVGAGYAVPYNALNATYFATVDHPVPWLTDGERDFEIQTMSSLSFGNFTVPDLAVAAETEILTVVIHNENFSAWGHEVSFNGISTGVDLNVVPGANPGIFEVSMTFEANTPAGFYHGNVVFIKGEYRITMPFAVHYYQALELLSLIDGSGIWRPIISNFVRWDADEDDIRQRQTPNIGVLTPSNWSTASFGFNTTTAPTVPREVEMFAVKNFDGNNEPAELSAENIFVLGSFNLLPNIEYLFADPVTAAMGGRLLPAGVYTFYAFVFDTDHPAELNLGQFVVTSERPQLIFDYDSAFTFGPDDANVRFSGRVVSWGHDMAIEHGITTPVFVEPGTENDALFDYRFAGYNVGPGVMFANPDGTFAIELPPYPQSFERPVEFVALSVDAFSFTAVLHPQGWVLESNVATHVSELMTFTHQYVGPAELPAVQPQHLSANLFQHVTEIVLTQGTPTGEFNTRLIDFNLEIEPNAGVYARSSAPTIRTEWIKDGEFFATGDRFTSNIIADWGIFPNNPDSLVSFTVETFFPSFQFGISMHPRHSGVYTMRVFAGDLFLGESNPINVTIEPLELRPGSIAIEYNWTEKEISFMQGTPQNHPRVRNPVDVTVTLSEDSGLHPGTFLRAVWIRASDGLEYLAQNMSLQQMGIDPSDPERLTSTTLWRPSFGNVLFGVSPNENGEWYLHISVADIPLSVSEDHLTVNIYPDLALEHLTVELTTIHPVARLREWQHPIPDELAPIRVDIDFGRIPERTFFNENTIINFRWNVESMPGIAFQHGRSLRELGIDLSNPDALTATVYPINDAFYDWFGNVIVPRWREDRYTLEIIIGGSSIATSETVEVIIEQLPPGSVEFNYINFPRFTNVTPTPTNPVNFVIDFETDLERDRLQFMWMRNGQQFSGWFRGDSFEGNRITLSLTSSWDAGEYNLIVWAYGVDDEGNTDVYNVITADLSRPATFAPGALLCECGCPNCPVLDCECDGDCDPNVGTPDPPTVNQPDWGTDWPSPPITPPSRPEAEIEVEDPEVPLVPTPESPFDDVLPADWFYDYVTKAANQGLFQGTAHRTFSPNTNMTRAMFVQVLANLAKDDQFVTTGESTFADVPTDAWFFEAVEWAANNGIVQGIDEFNFAPDAPITREQMAVMLYRFIQMLEIELPTASVHTTFTDQDSVSDWARDAVNALTAAGIFTGRPDGSFDSQSTATRAEVATVFVRLTDIVEIEVDETETDEAEVDEAETDETETDERP